MKTIEDIKKLLETTGRLKPTSKLRERNKKVVHNFFWKQDEAKGLREGLKKQFGIDVADPEQFPVMSESFSWKKLRTKLAEADASSTFTQFLRAGIQNITQAAYEAVDTTYEDWVTVVPSTLDTELYAPNHGVSFPREVGPQMPYPEVGAAALDLKLKNRKFGSMYAVERELLEDDQTGSFQRQASLLGEYLNLLNEVLCYGKLASVANMQYIDYQIPVSETKPSYETAYPWAPAATPLRGGGITRPTAYGALNQANIQDGIIQLMNQKNLQEIKMQVRPSRIIAGATQSFDLAVLLNSAYYPSGAAATGDTGGAFAINPIKGIADATITRYMFDQNGSADGLSKAWYLVDDSKPWFVLQQREAVAIMQEDPASGRSFELDIYRFKSRSRVNGDFIDPRFAWQGNDGSV